MLLTILVISGAYCLGSIPTGLLVTRLSGGIDIRKQGSGNIGATNVYRVHGRMAGILTLIGDTLKGVLAVSLADIANPELLPVLAGAAVVFGHMFSLFLRFRGGKGVATGLGVFLVLAPLPVMLAGFSWILSLAITRKVSPASLIAAAVLPLFLVLFNVSLPTVLLSILVTIFIIFKHRSNIQRLREGKEPTITLHRDDTPPQSFQH